MASLEETAESRVAVYIDFDNVVISLYDHKHGREAWRKDDARFATEKTRAKLDQARVDVGAILEYASSYGTIALSRAYADWSVPANASYRGQLVDRAIDLTQLFSTSGTKNGADIRLAVDVVDDLFRLSDITHVVIAAGDSDYIPLVQRCKRLGRVVVGIGVDGSTSAALVHALDQFASYDSLLTDDDESSPAEVVAPPATDEPDPSAPAPVKMSPTAASRLLVRAIELAQVTQADDEWTNASRVKSQMKRLNASFSEKDLGFANFMEFVRSRSGQVEIREDGQQRYLRLRPAKPAKAPAAAKPARQRATKAVG